MAQCLRKPRDVMTKNPWATPSDIYGHYYPSVNTKPNVIFPRGTQCKKNKLTFRSSRAGVEYIW